MMPFVIVVVSVVLDLFVRIFMFLFGSEDTFLSVDF